jgi:hypothetical protein
MDQNHAHYQSNPKEQAKNTEQFRTQKNHQQTQTLGCGEETGMPLTGAGPGPKPGPPS